MQATGTGVHDKGPLRFGRLFAQAIGLPNSLPPNNYERPTTKKYRAGPASRPAKTYCAVGRR